MAETLETGVHGKSLLRRRFRLLKGLVSIVLALGAVKMAWFAWMAPAQDLAAQAADLGARRRYLASVLDLDYKGPAELHGFLPPLFAGEWAIGSFSMAAVAFTNMAFDYPNTRADAAGRIKKMLAHALKSEASRFDTESWHGKAALDELSDLKGHAGYLCHLNLMLGALRILGDASQAELHDRIGHALEAAYRRSKLGLLETYPGQIWLPDNAACVASLAVWHRARGSDCQDCRNWIERAAQEYRDPKTGLLVFSVDPLGKVLSGPRGSGASWTSFYLTFADPAFAAEQFEKLKAHFLSAVRLDFVALREWPPDSKVTRGDIDSGPVIFGLSTSGTGFMLGPARYFQDRSLIRRLLRTAEAAGCTVETERGRRYLLAPVVGDAVMLAMRTAREWGRRFVDEKRSF